MVDELTRQSYYIHYRQPEIADAMELSLAAN
jgi:hypothetical protein